MAKSADHRSKFAAFISNGQHSREGQKKNIILLCGFAFLFFYYYFFTSLANIKVPILGHLTHAVDLLLWIGFLIKSGIKHL